MDERSITSGGSVGDLLTAPCGECDGETNHEVVASVSVKKDYDGGEITEVTHYQIVQCRGCDTHSFRRRYAFSEDVDFDRDGNAYTPVQVQIYPPRAAGRKKLRMTHCLPPKVRRIYEETHQALCSDSSMLAGVGIRSLVEAVCKEEDARGRDLKAKIDDLVNQGFLTQSGAEILQKLRLMGNEAVHEMKRHDTRKLGIAFDVVEHLLLGVYILSEEAERIK